MNCLRESICVCVTVSLPWASQPVKKCIDIDPRDFEAAAVPLPRDRELWFCFESRKRAEQQIMNRTKLARHISKAITDAIMDAVITRDPVNGYSTEEWKELNRGETQISSAQP